LTLSGPGGGASLGSQNTAVLTLIDNTQVLHPGTLQFNAAAYSGTVTSGTAVITVSRTNGTDGTVTVHYATSDGTAQAGVRYTATSGTLTFANGVTSQSFSVPLLNPPNVHGNQTVNLTLNNVAGYYTKFLGRTANAAEIAGWVTVLQQGSSPEQVIVSFVSSPEYFQKAGNTNSSWLDRIYQDLLGLARDSGSQGFLTQLN